MNFDKFANLATRWTGSKWAFYLATLSIIIWLFFGPLFDWSDTFQLVMNTITSIITFLMVFVIQQSQNKETLAIHIKLDELIACHQGARNQIIRIEDFTEDEIRELHKQFRKLNLKGNNQINLEENEKSS